MRGLGIIIGTVIGALTDNVGVWIGIGIVFGAGIGTAIAASGIVGSAGQDEEPDG